MTRPGAEHPQLTFSYVHREELSEVQKRREKQCYERADIDNPQPNLVGLALSGGGIRSATFCLGFLQELQRLRLLRIFDYLSTVSGGGYVGGWWSAWLSRRQEDVSQSPSFAPEDISNSVTLLKRIVETADAMTKDVKKHFEESEPGRILLGLVDRADLEYLSHRLYEPLAEELTRYVDKGDTLEAKWQRRASLIDTFPCELRGLFPPNEQIEPDRERSRGVNEKEAEGSRWAWEDPIHHLRLFANYLTPRKGILSADTWRAISVVTRNLMLTWLILLPLLVGVMLISQAYLLLHPTSYQAFICTPPNCPEGSLTIALKVILLPITVLLVATLVAAVAWLLCNRDSSSSLDWMVQWVGLFTLTLMFVAAIIAIPTLRDPIVNYFYLPTSLNYVIDGDWLLDVPADIAPHVLRIRLVTVGVLGMFLIVVLMWNLGINKYAFKKTGLDSVNFSSWKREMRRGRFGRAQARLLVLTAIVSVVLFLSWITCVLSRNNEFNFGLKVPFTLLPLLSAIGGSIFTALRATPVAEGDRTTSRQPSLISRFVFAASPPLVVGVLAVLAAWFVHWLLLMFLGQQGTPFGDSLFALLDGAPVLLTMLCIGLAIYELGDVQWSKVFKLSLGSVVFMCLVMINLSWFAQALLRYGYKNPSGPWIYLLVTSAFIAVLVTALVFRRMIPKGKWKWRLFRKLDFVRRKIRSKDTNTSPITAWRLLSFGSLIAGALMVGALTTVGFLIGLLVYLNTEQTVAGKISGALVLTLLALGGGVILFRLFVDRVKTDAGENLISLRLLGQRSFGKRPEALWLAASVCLTLPIIMICIGHYLRWRSEPEPHVKWSETLSLFPLTVIALLFSLMVLRSLVIQRQLNEGKPIVGWSGGIFEWLFDRIPRASGQNRRRAYQVSALIAICVVSLLDTVMRGFSPSQPTAAMGSTLMNWKWMTAAFVVSLPVFGVSVFQIPFNATLYERHRKRRRRVLHSKGFLWFLATACVGWAFAAGLLLPKWLSHVADIPLNTGLTPFLLPVAAGFLLIVLFEIYWGQRDNRRSLGLVAIGYLVVASIFFMNLAGASLSWHLVFGLLAAIGVWVAALGWMVDPNAVSMHQFYKGRLVRAYLGASNMRRKLRNKEITETVAGDDLPLEALINCERGGPYHLVNTTLNLVAGRDLATAQRSASSFVLSQTYCGSTRTKYCFTDEYMAGQLTLGTAIAASGAAVSPNMGAKKPTSALAMLMTLLNVRLGYWAPTPNRKGWNSSQPRLWPFYLVREFLSQTNDLSDYCYLTDGGHFDNTGLYSLIERGCRFVVLIDCGADPSPPCFEDLGEAIRRCRIDFGTEIDLNLDPFMKNESPDTASCFAVGKIKFSEEHLRNLAADNNGTYGEHLRRDQHGIIVYFKPAVIGNATADVRQYAIENTFFPQQPTTNQWFGEAQFESYRRLGQACAHSAFGHFRSEREVENHGRVSSRKIEGMFFGLHARGQKT